jgi:lipopolysaccharide transport system permease protein
LGKKLILVKSIQTVTRKAARLARWLPVPSHWWTKLDLLKILVQRDLAARYKGSVLGNAWTVLNQLAQLLIYTYLFSIVLKVKLSLKGLPDNDFTFGLWLFAGLIPWTAFVTGFAQSASAVITQPNLVKKVVFPLVLLPLVPICSAFVDSSMGLMLLLTFVAFSTKAIHGTLLLLPLIWIPQLLFTAGLGYLVAGLTVFLRDIPQTIAVILNLWFYITPIVYPVSAIPEAFRFWVLWLNPMTIVVEIYRDLVLVGEVTHWREWGLFSLISVVVFAIGLWVYRRLRPAFADVL